MFRILLVVAISFLLQVVDAQSIPDATVFAPNEISTGDYESSPAFTPDGKTLYFLKNTPDANFWTMVVSHLVNGHWTQPEVAPFSGQYSDADPFITPDGQRFFFISNRPPEGKENGTAYKQDIWMMKKTATGWTEPQNLGAPVNSEASEYYPTVAANGTLYFGSRRNGGKGGADLYRCRFVDGKYQEAENLGDAINTEFDEFEPYIAPDESYLIFMAGGGRPDSMGGYDFYISRNVNGQWTKAENLGAPFNSTADEYSPKFSPDGKYFVWSSARSVIDKASEKKKDYAELMRRIHSPQNGLGDLYYIDASRVKLVR